MSNSFKNDVLNFVYLSKAFSFLSLTLLLNLKKIIIRFRYGLFYYFFWLKTGCKNIKWKSSFTVFFLLDFIFASSSIISIYNFSISKLNYNILPVKKNNFTVSKGPMVRKKQSRVQYSFKQIFLNVTKVISFCNNANCKNLALNQLHLPILNKSKFENFQLFPFLNYNSTFFLLWVGNIKNLNFNIETNFFFLKKKTYTLDFTISYFLIVF